MIHYERRESAALITIDRPERHNAIDGDTAHQLLEGETLPLDQGLALEADLGRTQLTTAQEGARRFAQRK